MVPTVHGSMSGVKPRDVVIEHRSNAPPLRMNKMNRKFDALHYVLLFPKGDDGYTEDILLYKLLPVGHPDTRAERLKVEQRKEEERVVLNITVENDCEADNDEQNDVLEEVADEVGRDAMDNILQETKEQVPRHGRKRMIVTAKDFYCHRLMYRDDNSCACCEHDNVAESSTGRRPEHFPMARSS